MSRQLEPYQLIERSIQKKFHKVLWTPFITAIKQYELIAPGDRIAVCISGGKDSMLMAKLLQLLQRHSDVPFEVIDLVMDPGYNAVNRQKIESNAALLHIPVTIFETNIFDVTSGIEQSPCYLCARMRRGYLYSKARELGCNKIALGHHFSDVVDDRHGHVLRLAAAGHAAEAAQPQFPGHGAHPPHVLPPRGRHHRLAAL